MSVVSRSLDARRLAAEHAPVMRDGLFIRAGQSVWRHWREPIPAHLRRTKIVRQDRPGAPARRSPRHAVESLLSLAGRWPIRGRQPGADGYPILVVGTSGGVLLNPAGQRVAKDRAAGPVTTEQLALYRSFRQHISAPDVEVLEGGSWLVEEYVEGRLLQELPVQDQISVCGEIIGGYRSLLDQESRPAEGTSPRLHVDGPLVRWLPMPLRTRLEGSPLLDQARAWQEVPSFLDCQAGNVIVDASNDAVFIDCLPLRFMPFCYGPIYLIAQSANHRGLMFAYLDGQLDEHLEALFSTAGHSLPADRWQRESMLALVLVLRAVARAGEPRPVDLEVAARLAERYLDRSPLSLLE
jgi:hypothetical protein